MTVLNSANRSAATMQAASLLLANLNTIPDYAEEFAGTMRDMSKDLDGFRMNLDGYRDETGVWNTVAMVNWLTQSYEFEDGCWTPIDGFDEYDVPASVSDDEDEDDYQDEDFDYIYDKLGPVS